MPKFQTAVEVRACMSKYISHKIMAVNTDPSVNPCRQKGCQAVRSISLKHFKHLYLAYNTCILSWIHLCSTFTVSKCHATYHIDGLIRERCTSIANALDLRLPCTNHWCIQAVEACVSRWKDVMQRAWYFSHAMLDRIHISMVSASEM